MIFLERFSESEFMNIEASCTFLLISLAQHLLCKLSSHNLVRTSSYRSLSINLISIFALLCLFSNSAQSFSLRRRDWYHIQ